MDFNDILVKRNSVRQFSDKKVDKEKLWNMIRALSQAPSAGNLQAFRIYVARSKETKEGIVAAALGQDFIAQAPVVFIFFADKNRSASKYGERGADLYAIQDATIAAAYSQLAATNEGLSSVWVGAFDPLEVSRVVDAAPGEVPVAIIPIGYAAVKPGFSGRRPPEELVKEV